MGEESPILQDQVEELYWKEGKTIIDSLKKLRRDSITKSQRPNNHNFFVNRNPARKYKNYIKKENLQKLYKVSEEQKNQKKIQIEKTITYIKKKKKQSKIETSTSTANPKFDKKGASR